MRVHLLRSSELSSKTYQNVVNLLKVFPGAITFVPSEMEDNEEDIEYKKKIFENEKTFVVAQHITLEQRTSAVPEKYTFPREERVLGWDWFFAQCELYRTRKNIDKADLVVILSDKANDRNWFGGISDDGRNVFVHTGYWDYYFDSSIDFRYPVAYEVISWVLRSVAYESPRQMFERVHHTTIGCYMDLCTNKKDVLMKMRTADICPSCMQDIAERDLSSALVSQCIETMEGIRRSMTFRERFEIVNRPSRLEIRGEMKRIHLLDLGGEKVPLNPKERAVYLLFLKHEAGIRLANLQDHAEELAGYYRRFSIDSEPEKIEEAIQRLVNPLENNLSEVLSRIRRKFRDAVGQKMAAFYCIDGPSGSEKRISLDRSLVVGDL